MALTISKSLQWHMAHRLPDHPGGCRNLHGHTYRVEITVARPEGLHDAGPRRGMVADYGDLLDVLKDVVHAPLDHALLWWEGDELLRAFVNLADKQVPPLKTVRAGFTTTAENICAWLAPRLRDAIAARDPALVLERVTVWETETSSACWLRG